MGQRLLVVFIRDLIIDVFVLVVLFSWTLLCVDVYTGKAKLHSDAGKRLFCLGGVGWDEAFCFPGPLLTKVLFARLCKAGVRLVFL